MFDLSLSKLVLIGAVALVVVGPEKLPKVARMAGSLLGRAQRYFNDVKSEVSRDMALDDLHALKHEVHSAAQDIESSFAHTPSEEVPSWTYVSKARDFKRNKRRLTSKLRSLARLPRS